MASSAKYLQSHKIIKTQQNLLDAINDAERNYMDGETSHLNKQRPMYGQLVVVNVQTYRVKLCT